jgi:cytoskeleton protein RodZ
MNNPEEHSAEAESETLARLEIGARLKAAREARGLDRKDVAQRLRLDVHIIEALETDDLERLPARTFVRGYLRNYARLVELDEKLVAEALPEAEATPAAALKRRHGFRGPVAGPALGRWFGYLFLLAVLAALVLFAYPALNRVWEQWGEPTPALDQPAGLRLPVLSPESNDQAGSEDALEPIWPLPDVDEPDPAGVELPGDMPEESPAPRPPAAVAPESVPVPSPDPEPRSGSTSQEARLVLNFREESWVEIQDREGRLLYGLMSPGRREVLSGTPPFRLLLGNAAGVDLEYDGQAIDTSAHTRGAVARLRLE